jgi:hypothetical protein
MKPAIFIDTLILGIGTQDVPYIVNQFTSHLDKIRSYLEQIPPKQINIVINVFMWVTNQPGYTSEMALKMQPVYVLLKGSENVPKREYMPESESKNDTEGLGHLAKKLRTISLSASSDCLGKHYLLDAEECAPKRQKKVNVFTPDKKRREAEPHDNSSDIALHKNKKVRKRTPK